MEAPASSSAAAPEPANRPLSGMAFLEAGLANMMAAEEEDIPPPPPWQPSEELAAKPRARSAAEEGLANQEATSAAAAAADTPRHRRAKGQEPEDPRLQCIASACISHKCVL